MQWSSALLVIDHSLQEVSPLFTSTSMARVGLQHVARCTVMYPAGVKGAPGVMTCRQPKARLLSSQKVNTYLWMSQLCPDLLLPSLKVP